MIPHPCARAMTLAPVQEFMYIRRSKGSWQKHRDNQQALNAAGYGTITTEMIEAPDYHAESYHQQYLAKTQMGIVV